MTMAKFTLLLESFSRQRGRIRRRYYRLSIKYDSDTLEIDGGQLKVKEKLFEFPMYRDDDTVGITLKTPLYISEQGICPNAIPPFTTNEEGALKLNIDEDTLEVKDDKLFAKAQDATKLLKGAGAISVYRDPLESLEGAIVKLDVDHENFQRTGNKLSFRSTAIGEVPYDSGVSSLRRSDAFVSDSDEAVTSSYVQQLYQSGSAIDISGVLNGRREISL
ncbi:hypothetical protein DFS34DRAFT_605851 [Phlyctochytrium arcticum]|nr:hypothetical protein DFS34DRAFT_605851 [Phlyctochytrium arcticum]